MVLPILNNTRPCIRARLLLQTGINAPAQRWGGVSLPLCRPGTGRRTLRSGGWGHDHKLMP